MMVRGPWEEIKQEWHMFGGESLLIGLLSTGSLLFCVGGKLAFNSFPAAHQMRSSAQKNDAGLP